MCLTALLKGAVCCSGCERWAMKHCLLHKPLSNAKSRFHEGQLDPFASLKAKNVLDFASCFLWELLSIGNICDLSL